MQRQPLFLSLTLCIMHDVVLRVCMKNIYYNIVYGIVNILSFHVNFIIIVKIISKLHSFLIEIMLRITFEEDKGTKMAL